jgi:putative zinc finger/helix-turn-helix YgiT family protein
MTDQPPCRERPFPRQCPECGKVDVQPATIDYDAEIKHDGRLYGFRIPALRVSKCTACGEILFSNVTDDQISQALREHLGLLSPEQIRQRLAGLGLNQKEFGEQIAVAPETISRWLSGMYIQSRAMDKLMRMFFEREEAKPKHLGLGEVLPKAGELTPRGHPAS